MNKYLKAPWLSGDCAHYAMRHALIELGYRDDSCTIVEMRKLTGVSWFKALRRGVNEREIITGLQKESRVVKVTEHQFNSFEELESELDALRESSGLMITCERDGAHWLLVRPLLCASQCVIIDSHSTRKQVTTIVDNVGLERHLNSSEFYGICVV